MSLSAGIIGLPNVGKSTLFNALSAAGVDAENYPFCTVDPNVGVVEVPDTRLEVIKEHIHPEEAVPAAIEFVDIAGLVKGASEGEGLGNQFLSHIREVDALVHVVRCFEDDDVAHVEGTVDPAHDVSIVQSELIRADLDTVTGRLEKARRNARGSSKEAAGRVEVLEKVRKVLEQGDPVRSVELSIQERRLLQDSHLLTQKPVLYVANVSDEELMDIPDRVNELRRIAEKEGSELVVVCALLEEELLELDEGERKEMLQEFGIEEPALDRLIQKTYSLLGLQTFFTIANDKLRAWPLPEGSTAPEAAGVVHSDFQNHFIRAEVFSYEDLVTYESSEKLREAGKIRVEGKDYVVRDGDILKIKHDA